MLTHEQIEIAVKFWTNLFNKCVNDPFEQIRFERALRKVITQNRGVISVIALQVVPHLILQQALKEAKSHPLSLPFRKLDLSFQNGKVYLYERDQFVKVLENDF